MQRETHTIDATDKALGRIATQAVAFLRGKHKENFVPNKDEGDFVIVENFSKVKFSGQKLDQKLYYSHSGYLGGLKEMPLSKLYKEDPQSVLRRAVLGMLPKNKLSNRQIKRLKIKL